MTDTFSDAEEIHQLSFRGYDFACRVVPCENPVTEPIVVLCAAFQNMHSYSRYDAYWKDIATIIAVDPPGQYSPTPVPREHGYGFDADALLYLLDEWQLPRVNLLGVSLGFSPAHRTAQLHPDRIARLVLAGAAEWEPAKRRRFGEIERALAAREGEKFGQLALELFSCGDPEPTIVHRQVINRALRGRLASSTEPDMVRYEVMSQRAIDHPAYLPGRISGVPTLCLTGEHDDISSPHLARELASQIDDATFTLLRDTCHLSFLQRGAEWAETVRRFFTDQPLDDLDFLTALEHPAQAPA
ncbi:alpha/beta fold hydrolase [Actinoplanes sp. TFC3]|uniref:alpha/beta fold hydrolase n=1 Tax=Actinoplanes sp. TFC3 TaxID=1710355 RepID=UPI000AC5B1D0|nr:alpha/beta fold hydrolase [Actinoplanes sp. TFC3]